MTAVTKGKSDNPIGLIKIDGKMYRANREQRRKIIKQHKKLLKQNLKKKNGRTNKSSS